MQGRVGNDTFVGNDNDRGNIRLINTTNFRNPGVNSDANDFGNTDGVSRIDGSVGVTFTKDNANVLSINRGDTVNSGPYGDLAIGRSRSSLGRHPEFKLHELLLYKRVLSDTERAIVENYLKTKWGTP